jgi:hypothetical protein
MAWGNPCVSTPMGRLMPDTFLPASYPFCSQLTVFFTLSASMIRKPVMAMRPCLARASRIDLFRPAPECRCRPGRARPLGKVRMHRAPLGKSIGKHSPLKAPLKNVRYRIEHFILIQCPKPSVRGLVRFPTPSGNGRALSNCYRLTSLGYCFLELTFHCYPL